MIESFTLRLIVLAVLIVYLRVSMGRGLSAAEKSRREARERQWRGMAFDTSAIAPQIERLRRDYVGAVHCRPHQAFYRRGLIAGVRRLVIGLSYFHRVNPEHEMPKHDA